jgi:RNA polymerase sigma-70 factor (ECF subfamily)
MYRIAQNIWLDRGRAKKVRGDVVNLDDVPNLQGVDGREITEKRLTLEAVNAGMIRLTDDQRVLIALVCVDGLSYQEAADVLDLPIGTVMSRLARARKALSAAIGEEPETVRATRVEIKRA